MNVVIHGLEDIGECCIYTDTNSIHLSGRDRPKIDAHFREHRGDYLDCFGISGLLGTGLGQFHVDFASVPGCEAEAEYGLVVGKKCYADVLVHRNRETGAIEGCTVHSRMKGIPSSVLSSGDSIGTYERLMRGESFRGDWCTANKKLFRTRPFGTFLLGEYDRTVCFAGDEVTPEWVRGRSLEELEKVDVELELIEESQSEK